MAANPSPRPCRMCGKPKNRTDGLRHSWYCQPCEQIRYRIRDDARKLCDSKDPKHDAWYCDDCKAVRERQKEAAQRGAATRRAKYPRFALPANAEKFWQSKAHAMVSLAKKNGLLPALDGTIACTDCDKPAMEYDHRDYGRPLDVQPVCRSCNRRRGTAIWPSADQFKFRLITAPKPKRKAA